MVRLGRVHVERARAEAAALDLAHGQRALAGHERARKLLEVAQIEARVEIEQTREQHVARQAAGRFDEQDHDGSSASGSLSAKASASRRSARASASTDTSDAPLARRTSAQAATVAPDVTTSSTSSARRPRSAAARPRRSANAPATFALRDGAAG